MAHEVGYARVSKREQNPEAQAAELRAAGCERVFIDHGESSRVTDRPQWLVLERDKLAPGSGTIAGTAVGERPTGEQHRARVRRAEDDGLVDEVDLETDREDD